MNIPVKNVHIGKEIADRIDKLKISKSEFGRRIGMRQQHVNRLLDSPSLDTKKLSDISVALDYNFFLLYVDVVGNINAEKSAITWGSGNATVLIGDENLAAQIKVLQAKVESLQEKVDTLKENEKRLTDQLNDKKELNEMLKEKLNAFENK